MKKDKNWDGQTKANPLGIRIFMFLISNVGVIPAYILLFFISGYYTFFKNWHHKKVLKAYRSKLGLKTNIFHVYKHNFSFGLNMIDRFAHIAGKKSPFDFLCIGEENFRDALAKNKGLILLSAHIGNQEIAGDVLSEHISFTKINFLMLDNESKEIKKIFSRVSNNRQVNIIPTNSDGMDMMIKVKKALDNNEIVCMLGDRVMGAEPHIELEFLGKMAKFPTSPFNVAAITGSPIITAATIKTGVYKYTQKVYNFISFEKIPRSMRQEHIKNSMKTYVSILEDMVKNNPYSWFNFYDYWEEIS
ncbi:MAG: hypothetical protein HXX09_13285 [Bacteroidetes bacterium]|nr:hypothetical protein [Bacteroidota bacterium]